MNNYEQIKRLLKFDQYKNIVYRIQIIKRRKDQGNEEMENGQKMIKTYFIYNEDQFNDFENEIVALCDEHNARAYFEVNPRFVKSVGYMVNKILISDLVHQQDLVNSLINIDNPTIESYSTALNSKLSHLFEEKNKRWLYNKAFPKATRAYSQWICDVDFDENINYNNNTINNLIDLINEVGRKYNKREQSVITVIDTRNGCHVIFEPIRLDMFTPLLPDVGFEEADIHKDNFTLLYF